ncbi:uncharacterized protein G2W53_023644 [Senna tora]|uniref:Uncharacterized protein n=1 Tax=Senna tora TaxID=362788 RepID=A0A834TIP2_9FABA|nr:uncharacterized protein G2W53_023644 [Senna tora]
MRNEKETFEKLLAKKLKEFIVDQADMET